MREAVIKSMDWFLYDNGLRHERVKTSPMLTITPDHLRFLHSKKNSLFISLFWRACYNLCGKKMIYTLTLGPTASKLVKENWIIEGYKEILWSTIPKILKLKFLLTITVALWKSSRLWGLEEILIKLVAHSLTTALLNLYKEQVINAFSCERFTGKKFMTVLLTQKYHVSFSPVVIYTNGCFKGWIVSLF